MLSPFFCSLISEMVFRALIGTEGLNAQVTPMLPVQNCVAVWKRGFAGSCPCCARSPCLAPASGWVIWAREVQETPQVHLGTGGRLMQTQKRIRQEPDGCHLNCFWIGAEPKNPSGVFVGFCDGNAMKSWCILVECSFLLGYYNGSYSS